MLQNGYNLVGILTKHEYPSELKVWMEIVTDGTRTDLVQFTRMNFPSTSLKFKKVIKRILFEEELI